MMKTFSIGGIHPSDSKISKDCKIEVLPVPSKVFISVAQHLGAPATPIVKAGDQVKVGQVIAEPAGFISAYVHSSVSGTVKSVGPRKDLAGNNMTHIEIDVEGDEWVEGVDLTDTLVTAIPEDNKAILEKIKMCGVVGLGGATFPAHVKLCPPPGKKADCLILNGVSSAASKINGALGSGAKGIASFAKSIGSAQKSMFSLGDGIKSVMLGIIGYHGALTALNWGKTTLKLGAAMTEIDHIIESVFAQDGVAAVNKWAKDAITQFGLAEQSAKQYAV